MFKKIIFIILSLAIVTAGVVGFTKLNYWQRSISIFKYDSSAQQFGRGGRGAGMDGFRRDEGRGEGIRREIPDSIRQRFAREGRPPMGLDRVRPDSLFSRGSGQGRGTRGEGGFEGGMRRGGGPERGGHEGGKKINLETAGWFLAVFAAIVVIAIYTEKGIKLLKKKK